MEMDLVMWVGLIIPIIYNLLNSPYIQGLIEAYASGATILHAGSSVKKMRFVLPTDEVLDKYNNIEMKKFQLILNLLEQNNFLRKARDILLPRLMTGKINIDDLDIAVWVGNTMKII